jgi:RimJ/RimL family protein N-acetyltransferase
MVPVTARAATIEDTEAIARVHASSWQAAYRGIVGDDFLDGLSEEVWVDRWRTIFTEPQEGARTLVWDDGGEVTGFARIGPVRDPDPPAPGWDEVYAIYLDPRSWGQGAGSGLLTAALGTVAADVPGVSLWVFRDNARARAFYERHGFEVDGLAQEITIGGRALPEVRYRRLSVGSTTMTR